jgi:hypothetical protein
MMNWKFLFNNLFTNVIQNNAGSVHKLWKAEIFDDPVLFGAKNMLKVVLWLQNFAHIFSEIWLIIHILIPRFVDTPCIILD